jgi:hypothetical protein
VGIPDVTNKSHFKGTSLLNWVIMISLSTKQNPRLRLMKQIPTKKACYVLRGPGPKMSLVELRKSPLMAGRINNLVSLCNYNWSARRRFKRLYSTP